VIYRKGFCVSCDVKGVGLLKKRNCCTPPQGVTVVVPILCYWLLNKQVTPGGGIIYNDVTWNKKLLIGTQWAGQNWFKIDTLSLKNEIKCLDDRVRAFFCGGRDWCNIAQKWIVQLLLEARNKIKVKRFVTFLKLVEVLYEINCIIMYYAKSWVSFFPLWP
jgi:hypothetical protein